LLDLKVYVSICIDMYVCMYMQGIRGGCCDSRISEAQRRPDPYPFFRLGVIHIPHTCSVCMCMYYTVIDSVFKMTVRVMNGGVFLGNFVKSLSESYDLPISAMAVVYMKRSIFIHTDTCLINNVCSVFNIYVMYV